MTNHQPGLNLPTSPYYLLSLLELKALATHTATLLVSHSLRSASGPIFPRHLDRSFPTISIGFLSACSASGGVNSGSHRRAGGGELHSCSGGTGQAEARASELRKMMARSCSSLLLGAVAVALVLAAPALAGDPDYLQDVCVADLNSEVKVNGFPCKANATADDFFTRILAKPGATNNTVGSIVTGANVEKVPGLNTLGVSLARIDYAPGGLNPPHTHPRATELVFVLYGELDVGFITTANKLFSKTIYQGDVFTFPRGLVHFQKNNADKPAAVISAFNSQLPGTQSIAMTLFGASPGVPDGVLAKAFQISDEEVDKIKAKFAPKMS